MNELYIFGKANFYESFEDYKEDGREIWALGTDERNGADKYYELHGIKINDHDNVVYSLPQEVYKVDGIPINNSICALLVHAWQLGYKKIVIIGSPMVACDEYISQRPALAYTVGYLNGLGLEVIWRDLPPTENYGKYSRDPDNK